jgi:hypothetical protein
MFNIVIENVKHINWYNKIGDNFLSKTVPIYWGCNNIEDFGYDERGIIRFNNENELLEILNLLTPEMYFQMKPYIDYNCEIAKLDNLEVYANVNGMIAYDMIDRDYINNRLRAFLPRINIRNTVPPKWPWAEGVLTHYYVLKPEDYEQL